MVCATRDRPTASSTHWSMGRPPRGRRALGRPILDETPAAKTTAATLRIRGRSPIQLPVGGVLSIARGHDIGHDGEGNLRGRPGADLQADGSVQAVEEGLVHP